tara:strand:- start:132 stop:557 length:426 start_codon:yes stop_codon:yes gene_type:complete
MKELFFLLLGSALSMLLVWWITSKPDRVHKKQRKKTERMASGLPSRCIELRSVDEVFKHKHNPIYIDGKVYTANSWVSVDENIFISAAGSSSSFGYLTEEIVRSYKVEGRWHLVKRLVLVEHGDKTRAMKPVRVLSVLEIY